MSHSVSYTHLDVYKRQVVDVSTQKVLTLENGSTSQNANLVFAVDTNALYQQWQIKDLSLIHIYWAL